MATIYCDGEIVGGVRVRCNPPQVFTIPESVELKFDGLVDSWEVGGVGVRFDDFISGRMWVRMHLRGNI